MTKTKTRPAQAEAAKTQEAVPETRAADSVSDSVSDTAAPAQEASRGQNRQNALGEAGDGRVVIGDDVYMRDAKGRLTPESLVKPQDLLQDEMVRTVIGYAQDLSAQVARFRCHCFDDIGDFDALLAQEYGGHARESLKGNRTYMSYDGCLKVQVQIAERVAFGPELQIARDLVDECLGDWASDARDEIRTLVGHTFQVDKEGEISRSAIYSLLRLDIDDERWKRAMEAIRDAMRVIGSKTYIRCYRRANPDTGWQPVTIDLAKA